jgi:hypothetical protein
MEHKYVQIDKDGTVECTECGIRNSDPTAYFPENIMCDSITRIELLATIDEINQYLEGNVTKTGLQITLSELINKL